ncbi:MAG: hypothetical protein L0323_23810, partial [Planctomycetes bacterium]|nr:hypothetical protein [Planctomycetota bacterium]
MSLSLLFSYTPAFAAVLVQRFLCSGPSLRSLGIVFGPSRWFLVAWVVPFLLSYGTLCVGLLFPGARF